MDDIKAKQQIVEKIQAATSILVTVSKNPSVDALSAALGLTLLLDKLDKHPTAVFSGDVPPAIEFLEPEKTFDATTDSLRDFIIALDKEKADHLRYKVEGDSVRIFITPYKTTITSDDLEFSQGDFNVELVIALGVDNKDHLDGALEAHGQILHDADIITVTADDQTSNLGGIDWHDAQATSLSEMIAGLAEVLKPEKAKPLLDPQIATAILTGIVAQTDRFSNTHTTSHVMTIAAQLMAAGADQQLIASKLQETNEIGSGRAPEKEELKEAEPEKPKEMPKQPKDSLSINHAPNDSIDDVAKSVQAADQEEASVVATEALNDHTANASAAGAYAFSDDSTPASAVPETPTPAPEATPVEPIAPVAPTPEPVAEPTLGGHSYLAPDAGETPISTTEAAGSSYVLGHDEPAIVPEAPAIVAEPVMPGHLVIQPLTAPVAATPAALGLPMPPPLPDFSANPIAGSAYAVDSTPPPAILGDILAPEAPTAPAAPVTTPPVMPQPGQFQIPGQQ